MKKIIFNADDLGNSLALNQGIMKGAKTGVLNSTSLMATGSAFEDAVFNILPEIKHIKTGVHLNIIEGKSLTNPNHLCDKDGYFNKQFWDIMKLAQKSDVIKEIETEFRAQIEKNMKYINPAHLDSHVHTHAIPQIFELTCKLAQEYDIKRVRTQYEVSYITPNMKKLLTSRFLINLIKRRLLNNYTKINRPVIDKYGLKTNDFFVGVTYTGFMDEDSVVYGLKAIKNEDCIAEVLIHPHYYKPDEKILSINNFKEFEITQSETVKNKIAQSGFEY